MRISISLKKKKKEHYRSQDFFPNGLKMKAENLSIYHNNLITEVFQLITQLFPETGRVGKAINTCQLPLSFSVSNIFSPLIVGHTVMKCYHLAGNLLSLQRKWIFIDPKATGALKKCFPTRLHLQHLRQSLNLRALRYLLHISAFTCMLTTWKLFCDKTF